MSALTDLFDKIKGPLLQLVDRIQETSFYQKLKERYDGLPQSGQKAVLVLAALVILTVLFMIPLSTYWAGDDFISSFETKRGLIQDLFRVRTEAQVSLPIDPPPPIDSLKMQIESRLQQAQLTPEQMRGVQLDSIPNNLPRDSFEGAVSVSLAKLNIRQVVDLGYQMQSISTGIKMVDLIITANITDQRYFDVLYKFVSLKVPTISAIPAFDSIPNKRNSPDSKGKEEDL